MSDVPKKKKKAGGTASPSGKKKAGSKAGAASKPGTAAGRKAGSPGTAEEAGAAERRRLQAELEVAAAEAREREAVAKGLEAELAALHQQHAQEAATAADVLASQQREKQQAQEAAAALERRLQALQDEAARLRCALQRAQEAASAAACQEAEAAAAQGLRTNGELRRALSQSRQQEERIASQQQDMELLRQRLQRSEAAAAQNAAAAAALQVRAQGRSELRFVRGAPWLLKVGRQLLSGAAPAPAAAAPGGALAVAGRRLVLEGPALAAQQQEEEQQARGPQPGAQQPCWSLHSLDLSSGMWTSSACSHGQDARQQGPAQPPRAPLVTGRAVCSIGAKLLGFGGACEGSLLPAASCTQFLQPDLQQWLPAPPSADPASALPPPRQGAALAYCPRAHAAYLFGGQGEQGGCLQDLWRLDLHSMTWTWLDTAATVRALSERARTPCVHEAPAPCTGAALAVSRDGSRLWLMGGRTEQGHCTSALHWYDLGLHYWAAVDPQGSSAVDSRAQHAMACVGRFLVVAGGVAYTAGGQMVHRQDCMLYDTADGTWALLDSNAFAPAAAGSGEPGVVVFMAGADYRRRSTSSGSSTSSKLGRQASAPALPFLGAGSCAFVGSKLLLLKPSPKIGLLSELWTVDLTLPEEVEQQQQALAGAATVVQQLTLVQEAVAPTSVQLSWRVPTANRDKLLRFKLMMTGIEGRAQEAYEGTETSCHVTGLAPASQFIFCVKALYDDASFLWSEPLMVTTAKASRPQAKQMGGGS